MMRKTFVLDTNVLLHEPRAYRRFADNDVVLPIYVVEELDGFKKAQAHTALADIHESIDELLHYRQHFLNI